MANKRNIKLETKLGEPSPEALALPFYNLLPKDKVGLLKWRIYVKKRCIEDVEFRNMIWQMCSQDVCFFANTFCWLHETREGTDNLGKFPVVLDMDQVDILAWFQKYAGRSDMTVEKTRGVGLSWLLCILFIWLWLFRGERLDFALVSKDDSSLDMRDRPSTLMGKLDLLFAALPFWMTHDENGKKILDRTSTKHKFINLLNGNAILGFVPTDDKLRSGRYYIVGVDEAAFLPIEDQRWLASSQHTSPCRLWISTHDGTACMFYRLTVDEKSDIVRISTWWWANTRCARGLYRSVRNQVEKLDPNYKYSGDYKFSHDNPGLLRSPWVDDAFNRPGSDPVSLMQELFGTAALDLRKLLQAGVIKICERHCQPAPFIGKLSEEGDWIDDPDGAWRFWKDPMMPFTSLYYIGVDPALGVADGAFAALSVIDAKTGEQVAGVELVCCNTITLARLAVALAKLLSGPRGAGYAQIVPESTGIGVTFLTELERLRYPAVYKDGTKVGIHTPDSGEKVLTELGRAIQDGDFVPRDSRLADELPCFEYDRNMDLQYTGVLGHGDLAMATALAWWAARVRRQAFRRVAEPKTHGLLREPSILEQKRNNDSWSSQFDSPRRR